MLIAIDAIDCVFVCAGQEGPGPAKGSRGGNSQDGHSPEAAEGTRAEHRLTSVASSCVSVKVFKQEVTRKETGTLLYFFFIFCFLIVSS